MVPPPRIVPNDRHAVTLTVDGQPVPLDCGRRALRRATFDVRAVVAGRDYLLHHERRWRAWLLRDGQPVSRLSMSDRGAMVHAEYESDAVDATVEVSLGIVLGVGAPGFFRNLLAVL